jgi:hypothetical protein
MTQYFGTDAQTKANLNAATSITRAPLGGALYARKCFFFSKDEAFVRHGN